MALTNSLDSAPASDAEYPKNMTNSGYGGTASLPTNPEDDVDEEYDEEELTITDDDDEPIDLETEEDEDV